MHLTLKSERMREYGRNPYEDRKAFLGKAEVTQTCKDQEAFQAWKNSVGRLDEYCYYPSQNNQGASE